MNEPTVVGAASDGRGWKKDDSNESVMAGDESQFNLYLQL
jgi:hypothetical protein